ncbi:hypothetical protein PQX77_015472 [Marasmius sp. AFHP31]|nr:hypothetical protein PQX77_015472 [Marasmius sp. AFHP31]
MSFFPNSDRPKFYNGTFIAANKVVNVRNYYGPPHLQRDVNETGTYECGVENAVDYGNIKNRFRTILEGDLVLLREVAFDVFDIKERSDLLAKLKTTNPFRVRLEKRGTVTRMMRKVHTAEIVGFEPRKFTVVTFDTTDDGGVDGRPNENAVWRRAYALSSSERLKRATHFPQLFALSCSNLPSLIYHDELVSGADMRDEFRDVPIITCYLHYLFQATYFTASRDDAVKKLSITLPPYSTGWFFNLRNGSFQFDVTSPTPEQTNDSEDSSPDCSITQRSVILCPDIGPSLTPEKVVTHLQRVLSHGYLHSLSSLGEARRVESPESLKEFTRHGLLTFGSVIDLDKDELVGHFPLTPLPQWYCQSYNSDVTVKYSSSVKSRLELTFNPDVEGRDWELELHFGLKLPFEASEQMRLAFLRQSPSYQTDKSSPGSSLVFLEELQFLLHGKISRYESTFFTSDTVYLFIPPLTAT